LNATEQLVENAERHAQERGGSALSSPPKLKLAVVACMDARLNVHEILGLAPGDAHVISNAGGVVTDDEIRSLAISQHLLGTQEIVLIHHTDCGMLSFTDDEFADRLEEAAGQRPSWRAHSFPDLEADVREQASRLRESPFLAHTDSIRGFVYDVATGELTEVDLS
jgi:carbonic anhydrase